MARSPNLMRLALSALIQHDQYLDAHGKALTATAIARRLGSHRQTVRRWLKADFPDLYERHFMSASEIIATFDLDRVATTPKCCLVLPDMPKLGEDDVLP